MLLADLFDFIDLLDLIDLIEPAAEAALATSSSGSSFSVIFDFLLSLDSDLSTMSLLAGSQLEVSSVSDKEELVGSFLSEAVLCLEAVDLADLVDLVDLVLWAEAARDPFADFGSLFFEAVNEIIIDIN